MSDVCPGCDGGGWYHPVFSPSSIVDCQACNADWHKPPPGVTAEQWASEEWWSSEPDVPALTERVDHMIASCERQSAEIKALLEQKP